MILSTGMYNVNDPKGGRLFEGVPAIEVGPAYTQQAVDSVLPGYGGAFVAVALLFFAFTTILAYYYMAETNVAYINRKVHRPWTTFVLRLAILAAVTFGSIRSAEMAWTLGDIGVGPMAWLNIIAILILQMTAMQALRDYERMQLTGI